MSPWLRVLFLITLGLVSACQSGPSGAGAGGVTPRPHYKIGEPYEINGIRYTPAVDRSYDQIGIASWYGDEFHGRPTANGEIFDKRRLTAAHKTLPMPTLVEVENLENGRTIVVRLNDRGPFVDNRLIDVSHAAADALGFTGKGLARVRVRYLAEAALGDLAPMRSEAKLGAGRSDVVRKASARPTELWVELTEIASLDHVETLDLAQLGPVSIVSSSGAASLPYSLRIGPFAEDASAREAMLVAKSAGFPAARVLQNASRLDTTGHGHQY